MIPVTKTFLPPQKEYQAILSKAWDKGWITNRGDLVKQLEFELRKFLNVPNVLATTNGTLPLQISIKALKLEGEIITTPFSYIATTSSIVWEGCKPVYVDIHPEYLTIDESKIEKAITPATSAILATHVFGNPCEVEIIDRIAKKYDLKVIYDAAHCFGVNYKGKSIFNYGDISTCSFHATKLFHTGEGGALFCSNTNLFESLYFHHNFGHDGPEVFRGLGINAKMSELQAAMGLAILKYMDSLIQNRKKSYLYYEELLHQLPEIKLHRIRSNTDFNYSYFPVLPSNEMLTLKIIKNLKEENIFPRRYFYPALNLIDYVSPSSCKIAESCSSRILCLPLFHDITEMVQNKIVEIIKKSIYEL